MTNRFPSSYKTLAGFAGAIAWLMPYFILPFVPRFPTYDSPPYHIHLTELTISYSIAGLLAGVFFLIGLRFIPLNRESSSHPVLSFKTVFTILMAMAVGGAFAGYFAFYVGFSPSGYSMMADLGTLYVALDKGPEPFLSIGLVVGTDLAAIIILWFSGIMRQSTIYQMSPIRFTLEFVLKVSAMVLIGRLFIYTIWYSSFAEYTVIGQSIIFSILVIAIGGALFGVSTWSLCSKIKAT